MSDAAFRNAPPSPNVEDRRGEFSDIQHLMMQLGLIPLPEQDAAFRAQQNLQPGEWLDYSDPNVMPPLTTLGIEAGGNDLDNQHNYRQIANGLLRKEIR